MSAAQWQFVLTDTAFVPVGDMLNLKGRTVGLALNKPDTLSCTMRLDNPLADEVVNNLGYIKAYRDGVLAYFGPIISAEESADSSGAVVAITSAGAAWNMTKRLVGMSAAGQAFTVPTDRAEIARLLIDGVNRQAFLTPTVFTSSTGIATTEAVTSGSTITYTAGPYKTLYDCVTELSTGFDAFDWRVLPVENFNSATGTVIVQPGSPVQNPWSAMGKFVAAPKGSYGAPRPEAVFEWGTGRNNMKSYSRVRTRDTQANYIIHNAAAGPDAVGYPTVGAVDFAAAGDYRILMDIASADLSDLALRTQLVNEHLRIRKNPRMIVKFEPHIDPQDIGTLPRFGSDYDIGDYVPVRAVYGGQVRVDAYLRIWGITFSIDDNGVERASAVLAAQDN